MSIRNGSAADVHTRRAGLHRPGQQRAATILLPIDGRIVRIQRTVRIEERRSSHGSVMLKNEAATKFNRWLAAHSDDYPDELPVGEKIAVDTTMSKRLAWITYVDRESLEELGPGEEDGSPVDSVLRFIAWVASEIPEERGAQRGGKGRVAQRRAEKTSIEEAAPAAQAS